MRFCGQIWNSVRGFVRQHGANDARHIDVRLMVSRLHEFGVGDILIASNFTKCRNVGKAQEEMVFFRLFDSDGECPASVIGGATDFETHPLVVRPSYGVLDFGVAEIEPTHEAAVAAFKDVTFLQSRQKKSGILGAGHQAEPELIARQVNDHRVVGIVDLDDVFEFHGAIVAFPVPLCHLPAITVVGCWP